jgi:hypothetical protein
MVIVPNSRVVGAHIPEELGVVFQLLCLSSGCATGPRTCTGLPISSSYKMAIQSRSKILWILGFATREYYTSVDMIFVQNHCVSRIMPNIRNYKQAQNTTFRETYLFPFPGERMGRNRVRSSLPTSADGNRPNFQNVVSFSSYFEFRTMDKVHRLSDSECYGPSSGPFGLRVASAVLHPCGSSFITEHSNGSAQDRRPTYIYFCISPIV